MEIILLLIELSIFVRFGFMTLIIYRYIIRKLNLWNSDNGLK